MLKKSILSPGPSPIPQGSLLSLANHTIHHRSSDFSFIYREVLHMIKMIYQTKSDVFPIYSSGTGALEAAIVNTLSFQDTVLIIRNGIFSNRWYEICSAFNLNIISFNLPYGKDICLKSFESIIKKNPNIKAILFLYSETSTGSLLNAKKISQIIRKNLNCLILVDAITAILVHKCHIDKWDLDVVISSSQKSYMSNPGICFLSFSSRAWEFFKKSNLPKFYFNIMHEKKGQKKNMSSWTPPIHTFYSLYTNLKWITKYSNNFWISHYKKIAEATRLGIKALNLNIFPENPSNALTVFELPQLISSLDFSSLIEKKYKIYLPSGHQKLGLKNPIFRIGHIGFYDESDIMKFFHSLELILKKFNYPILLGSSFKAIQDFLYKVDSTDEKI